MLVLALETATPVGGIAIVNDGKVIAEMILNIKATHSEKLFTAMDHILKDSDLTISDMDAVAVSIGPGSFTGLRIGLSAAKGLAFASNIPLIGIPTLDALAMNVSVSSFQVCPILDARKEEIYAAIYRNEEAGQKKVVSEMTIRPEAMIERITEDTVFLGDGVRTYGGLLASGLKGFYHEAPMSLQMPRASNIGMLAVKRLTDGERDDPFSLTPLYIRKSEAELKWKG